MVRGQGVLDTDYKPTITPVDNSFLAHGGKFTCAIGNKAEYWVGSGGFHINTSGNIFLHSTSTDILSSRFNVKGEEVIIGMSDFEMNGGSASFNNKSSVFQNQVTFLNNVVIKGGLLVSGETYTTHQTTMGQSCLTDPCEPQQGIINPTQSFMVYNGASKTAQDHIKTPWKPVNDLPDLFGYVDAMLAASIDIPGFEGIYHWPCRIAFPNGISICSDAAMHFATQEKVIGFGMNPKRKSRVEDPDISLPGHVHQYIGVGTGVNGSAEFGSQSEQCLSNKPVQANKTNPYNWTPAQAAEQASGLLIDIKKVWLADVSKIVSQGANVEQAAADPK